MTDGLLKHELTGWIDRYDGRTEGTCATTGTANVQEDSCPGYSGAACERNQAAPLGIGVEIRENSPGLVGGAVDGRRTRV